VRPAAQRPIAAKQRVYDRLGRVEPDLRLPVVLQASKGVEQQQWLVRGPPAAAGELTDAVKPASRVSRSTGTAAGACFKPNSDMMPKPSNSRRDATTPDCICEITCTPGVGEVAGLLRTGASFGPVGRREKGRLGKGSPSGPPFAGQAR
jgi:hypothetical protein